MVILLSRRFGAVDVAVVGVGLCAQVVILGQLLEAGVHVYLYQPRFLHAKHVTIDGEVTIA